MQPFAGHGSRMGMEGLGRFRGGRGGRESTADFQEGQRGGGMTVGQGRRETVSESGNQQGTCGVGKELEVSFGKI